MATFYIEEEISVKEYMLKKLEEAVQGKTVDDIEVGMFLRSQGSTFICLGVLGFGYIHICPFNVGTKPSVMRSSAWAFVEGEWSYTYNGIYKSFVKKETEEQRKIQELEETINKAKQQIQELKSVVEC